MNHTAELLMLLSHLPDFKMWRETKVYVSLEGAKLFQQESSLFFEAGGLTFNGSRVSMEEAIFSAYHSLSSQIEAKRLLENGWKPKE